MKNILASYIKPFVLFAAMAVITSCAQQDPAKVIFRHTTASVEQKNLNPYKLKIKEGDTVYSIAKEYNLEIRDIIDLNKMRPPYALTPGYYLRLPKATFHMVSNGDTLYSISRTYGLNLSSIVRANNLKTPYIITPGTKLRLPAPTTYDETDLAAEAAPEPTLTTRRFRTADASALPSVKSRSLKPLSLSPERKDGVPNPILRADVEAASAPAPALRPGGKYAGYNSNKKRVPSYILTKGSDFSWPTSGRVVSRFGPKKGGLYNDGINIAAAPGTPIKAAADGNVVYAGNELRGYGNLLLIRHDNGYLTAYAHTQGNQVRKGERVSKGQTIAKVGKTGHVSTPQLHFSIRKGRKALNPEKYLPKNFSMLN